MMTTIKTVVRDRSVTHFVSRILFTVVLVIVSLFFALPMVWLVLAPFDATPVADGVVAGLDARQLRATGREPLRDEVDPQLADPRPSEPWRS